jgi:serine/threonine protein phosphatase PrpC
VNNVIEQPEQKYRGIDQPLTAMRGKLKLDSAGYSVAGVKAHNEDAFGVAAPSAILTSAKGIVAAIADGVSHASQAAKASAYCIDNFKRDYYKTPTTWSTGHAISDVLAKINSGLFNQPDSQSQWLTTFSGVVFKSATAHIFHVGDTQILRIADQQLKVLTSAHNQTLGNKTRLLTRAMGADNHLKVDYQAVEIQVGDVFILTSDGVHDHISEAAIMALVNKGLALRQLAEQLAEQAKANGSLDNLSCLAVRVEQVPQRLPEEIRQSLTDKAIPPALEPDQVLEGYKVVKTLHASSRSHLYLVEDTDNDLNRLVLKAPSSNFEDDEIYLQGFIHEAWVGSQINNPLIMKVYPAKAGARFLYHVCEYIEGQTLRQWMLDHPKPSIDEVRRIIKQVCDALRIFERLDIVHRDLKPENLMIDRQGQIKLIDYGTASVAALEEQLEANQALKHPLGTVNYIAPETLINLTSTYQSDLFSVGVITYEMLTGQLPYPAQLRAPDHPLPFLKWQYRSGKDFRGDMPFWLDLALMKAVQANPEHRYQAYSEFVMGITKPNLNAEQAFNSKPLLERDPVRFWQLVSIVLAVVVVILLVRG